MTWLLSHPGNDMMNELRTSGLDLTYADSVLEALRDVVKGHGRCLSGVVFIEATNIQRDWLAIVEQFVKKFNPGERE